MNETILWSPGMSLEAVEKLVILSAFRHYRGNKSTTATALGIAIRTLDSKLESYAEEGRKLADETALQKQKDEDYLRRARGIPNAGVNTTAEEIEIQRRAYGLEAPRGLPVEPATQTSTEQPVSMPERKEVQTLPSQPTPKSSPRKRRSVSLKSNVASQPEVLNERE